MAKVTQLKKFISPKKKVDEEIRAELKKFAAKIDGHFASMEVVNNAKLAYSGKKLRGVRLPTQITLTVVFKLDSDGTVIPL